MTLINRSQWAFSEYGDNSVVACGEVSASFVKDGIKLIAAGPEGLEGAVMGTSYGVDTQRRIVYRHGKASGGERLVVCKCLEHAQGLWGVAMPGSVYQR